MISTWPVEVMWVEKSYEMLDGCCPGCKSTDLSCEDDGILRCNSCNSLYQEDGIETTEGEPRLFFGDGYELEQSDSSPYITVVKSPFYTLTRLCTQSFPNAGNLEDTESGVHKTYCLGHEWFNDPVAIYPVYSVDTDKLVYPRQTKEPVIAPVYLDGRRFIDLGR